MTTLDREVIREAYDAVRDDKTEVTWLVLKYEGNQITILGTGNDFDEFRSHFTESERLFGYIRMCTGDEMSKRAKFAFITWIGNDVNPLKRAKISVDKAKVKEAVSNFAIEITSSELEEITENAILEKLQKAGGANYGTGQ